MTDADRRDVIRNRAAILAAAAEMLADGDEPTAGAIAWRAGLARATVYRHFPTVAELVAEARELLRVQATASSADDATGPGALDLPGLLDRVAPPQLPEQIVAEAQSRAGAREVALYLVDLAGTHLLRLAGSRTFPEEIAVPIAVGPEISAEAIDALHDAMADELPNATVAPMVVRERATGVLAALDAQDTVQLQTLARQAGIALAVSERFTDVVAAGRRRRPTTAAAETQQILLAPRVARLPGLRLAGNVLPAYENGGNWFDHAENEDGAWIAAVDTLGVGPRAVATAAVALGALRAARTVGSSPVDAIVAMDETIRAVGGDGRGVHCSAFVARWHPLTATLFWVSAGDLHPVLVDSTGTPTPLRDHALPRLGTDELPQTIRTAHRTVAVGERVLLLSDGVAGTLGAALTDAELAVCLRSTVGGGPAQVLHAIESAIRRSGDHPTDDAMTVVLARPTATA